MLIDGAMTTQQELILSELRLAVGSAVALASPFTIYCLSQLLEIDKDVSDAR